MGVGQPQGMLLNLFGEQLRHAFGHVAYHVGSSLDLKNGWRDVDVRLMLPDEEWVSFMLGDPANPHTSPRWRTLCIVWSSHGRAVTGLPIDFQLQQRTQANAEYPPEKGCSRSALIVADDEALREFAFRPPLGADRTSRDAPDHAPIAPGPPDEPNLGAAPGRVSRRGPARRLAAASRRGRRLRATPARDRPAPDRSRPGRGRGGRGQRGGEGASPRAIPRQCESAE